MQFETSQSVAIDVAALVRSAARSMAASLDVYWPADEDGRNDSQEKFLSFHFAHAFLRTGYAVFAEAKHPNPKCRGLDLLAISKHLDHFVACEFKRHTCSAMTASLRDIERVASFHLNDRLRIGRVGDRPLRVVRSCELGIGLLAGLNWSPGARGSALACIEAQRRFTGRIAELGGAVGEPEHVYRYDCADVQGAYYVQFACFPSWRASK